MDMGEMRLKVIVDGGVQRRGVAVPRISGLRGAVDGRRSSSATRLMGLTAG